MTVKERLIKFAKTKERSIRAFEKNAGLNIGYINAIRVSIQPEKLKSITGRYPDLNTGWLLTGEGEMLRKPVATEAEEISQQIGQGFFERVLKLIQSGDLYPSNVVEGYKNRISELEIEAGNLQREIGRLEAEVKELKNK